MAIKHSITLSTTEPNNEVGVIKIRQADEQTQTLEVQITENGVPKSYQGLAVYFCAKLGQTAGLGIIEQKLKPEEMTNPANGKLEYTMRAEDWQISGRQKGYFSFRKMKDEHEFVEQFTTRDFTFEVIKSVYSDGLKEVKKDGSTYVWTIEEMLRLFKEYIATGKIEWENYKNDERTIWEKFVEDNREFLENADPGGKIILELLGGRGGFDSLGERLDESDKVIKSKSNDPLLFLKMLNGGQVTKIKLIGDSITEGVGATGHTVPSDNPIIYNDGVDVYREGNYTAPTWANKFRNYISENYPNVDFVNAGIGGMSTKRANPTKNCWIDENEDIVFVQLGTNDRWACADKNEFKAELTEFLSYVAERSNLMIVMTATPTGNDYTDVYLMGMKEIDSVIADVCQSNGYIHISNYRDILSYAEKTGTLLDFIILNGGSHPSDLGYSLVWVNMQEKLGIISSQAEWVTTNSTVSSNILLPVPYFAPIQSTTLVTDPIFKKGKMIICETDASSDVANFPENSTGKLSTYRSIQNDLYSYQVFEPRGKNSKYRRFWEYSNNRWSSWFRVDGNIYYDGSVARTANNVISDYVIKRVEYCDVTTTTNTPGNQTGTLETYRGSYDVYTYQLFYVRGSLDIYRRYWATGTNTWSVWQKIGGKMAYTTAERNALPANTLNQGDMVYDSTLHKPVWHKGAGIWVDSAGVAV